MTKEEFLPIIKELSVGDLIELLPVFRQLVTSIEALGSLEESTFDVIMTDRGEAKINVIKAIRTITNLGLKESKELSEQVTPVVIFQGVSVDKAKKAQDLLEEAGATVSLVMS